MAFLLLIYVAAVSWNLSRIYHKSLWERDILRRVESCYALRYGSDRGAKPALHLDQDCAGGFRPLALSLGELSQALHRRPSNVLRPAGVRWKVPPSRFTRVEFG